MQHHMAASEPQVSLDEGGRPRSPKVTIVQCWDDGVVDDIRLTDLLRRHGVKATFNINPGLHKEERAKHFEHRGKDVIRLAWSEMRQAYEGFTIGNHSMSHPRLAGMPVETASWEIGEAKRQLQDFFGQPVLGFAYPFGSYCPQVMEMLRSTGHVYARTCQDPGEALGSLPGEPMAFHPSCHFLAEDFWQRLEQVKSRRDGGIFYFWGHSYELMDEPMWQDFEDKIQRITADPDCCWGDLPELFRACRAQKAPLAEDRLPEAERCADRSGRELGGS